MGNKNSLLTGIETNSDTAYWTREYNAVAARIEAGYVNEDAYQPLKQQINEYLDYKFKKRKFWKKLLTMVTVVMLLMWVAAFIASRFYDPIGFQSAYVAGRVVTRKAGIINGEVMRWLEFFMIIIPALYIVFFIGAKVRKLQCEKAIVDAMTFDKRYLGGEICRLRNTSL